jgi:hypothetical protein
MSIRAASAALRLEPFEPQTPLRLPCEALERAEVPGPIQTSPQMSARPR